MKLLALALTAGLFLGGCGKDTSVDPTKPEPDCKPVAVAETGGDVYFSPDPAQGKFSKIGTPAVEGLEYQWSPEQGLSDARIAQPILSAPASGVIKYELEVRSPRCGTVARQSMRAVRMKAMKRPDKNTVEMEDSKGKLRTYFTGYAPDGLKNIRKPYRKFETWEGLKAGDPLPREFDVEKLCGPLWVGTQQCGDCWLWATQGTIEDHIQCRDGVQMASRVEAYGARQEGIDCSGGGSCGGGYLIFSPYVRKGFPHTEDYGRYLGRNSSCKKDFTNFKEPIKSTYEVKYTVVGDLMRALVATQASIGVCGASRALSNSNGWQESAINAGTDHCYVLVGFVHGEDYGHKAGIYGKFKNSWGRGFGKNGFVYVWLGADENDKVRGTVITEAETIEYKAACPTPKGDAGPDRTVTLAPGRPNTQQLGTPAEPDVDYTWSPATGLSDIHAAMPLATGTPMGSITYTRTAKNKCGEVKDDVLFTVYRE